MVITPFMIVIFVIIGSIEIVLKLFACWKAAKKNQKVWYVILFLINTAGILPLVYLLLNRENKYKPKKRVK